MRVPLVEPRSLTNTPSPRRSSSQWWRDTVSSGKTRSLSVALPTRTRSRWGAVCPDATPVRTSRVKIARRLRRLGAGAGGDGSVGLHVAVIEGPLEPGSPRDRPPGFPRPEWAPFQVNPVGQRVVSRLRRSIVTSTSHAPSANEHAGWSGRGAVPSAKCQRVVERGIVGASPHRSRRLRDRDIARGSAEIEHDLVGRGAWGPPRRTPRALRRARVPLSRRPAADGTRREQRRPAWSGAARRRRPLRAADLDRAGRGSPWRSSSMRPVSRSQVCQAPTKAT